MTNNPTSMRPNPDRLTPPGVLASSTTESSTDKTRRLSSHPDSEYCIRFYLPASLQTETRIDGMPVWYYRIELL